MTANTSLEGRQTTEADAESPGSDLRGSTREQVDEIGRLNAQLEQLRRLTTTQAEAIAANTKALESSGTQSKTQTESSGQGIGSKIFSSMLGGFGIGSMISEIVGLFGGGKSSSEVPALVSYSLPPAIRMENGVSSAGAIAPVQYSQTGSPRPESPAPSQQVVVQIQALDSRSVLDRSDDIARAVREAMLHSHSLNDVVNDL